MKRTNESGFTIIEIMIAVIVLVVGALGLVMTSALLTRMMGWANRAQQAANYASQRMEMMRTAACISAQRTGGVDSLLRGNQLIAINRWSYALVPTSLPNGEYQLQVITTWKTRKNKTHTDTLEAGVPCTT